jgi:glycosyltransferase involved in cell wall biosynthesis
LQLQSDPAKLDVPRAHRRTERGKVDVVYLCNAQIPSRSTNALQVVRMCEGFRQAGADVTLVHPFRIGNRPEGLTGDVREFYGVSDPFDIVTLPTPLTRGLARTRWIGRPVEALPLTAYLAWRFRPNGAEFVCYGRSMLGAWTAMRLRRALGGRGACRGVFVEVHDRPTRDSDWRVLEDANGVVTISDALRNELLQRSPRLRGRIWVEHDAVRLSQDRSPAVPANTMRSKLGIASDRPVVVYAGRVNEEKGVGVLLDAAGYLPETHFVLVGKVYQSTYEDRARHLGNVTLVGFVPPSQVPRYLALADAVVAPSRPSLPYAAYMSPLKLFEYMASGKPIVASDLPVLREILVEDRNALLYPPSDPSALAASLERVIADKALATRLADQARRDVEDFTWDKRAARILALIGTVAR